MVIGELRSCIRISGHMSSFPENFADQVHVDHIFIAKIHKLSFIHIFRFYIHVCITRMTSVLDLSRALITRLTKIYTNETGNIRFYKKCRRTN